MVGPHATHMRRRPFLHLAVGAVATAGCLGRPDDPADSPSGTGDATGTDATTSGTTAGSTTESDSGSTTEMAATDGGSLTVERVESFDYVVRMNDLGHDPVGTVTRFAELTDREQSVVEEALDGGYGTDDPPEWLVQFAADTPVVARSDTYYRLDHDFPTTTVTAETVEASAVDGKVADYETYEAAVTHDGLVMSGLLRIARQEGMEFTYVWPGLGEFLDEYSAVRYRGEVVAFSVDVEDSGPPYAITASEASVSEAVGADVWNVSNADGRTRDLVRAAGTESGTYGVDDPPEGFLDALDAHEYAYLDGTFYTTYVEAREPAPVSLSAAFADGELTLSLSNDADYEVTVSTGAPPPFGVQYVHPVGESDEGYLLWTDAYAESDHVHTEGRDVNAVNSIGLLVQLAPGETTSETYAVPVEDLPSGEYVVDLSVGVERRGTTEDDPSNTTARFRVVFGVE